MRARRREINIFNMSLLDILCGALGAFCFMMLVALPYYKPTTNAADLQKEREKTEELMRETENLRERLSQPGAAGEGAARDLEELLKKLQAQIQALQGQVNMLTAEKEQLQKQAAQLMAEKEQIAQENQTLRASNQSLEDENQKLKARLLAKNPFTIVASTDDFGQGVDLVLFKPSIVEKSPSPLFNSWLKGEFAPMHRARDAMLFGRGVAVYLLEEAAPGAEGRLFVRLTNPLEQRKTTAVDGVISADELQKPAVRLPKVTLYPERYWLLLGTLMVDQNGLPDFKEATETEREAAWKTLTSATPPPTPTPTPPPTAEERAKAQAERARFEAERARRQATMKKFATLMRMPMDDSGKNDAEILKLTEELLNEMPPRENLRREVLARREQVIQMKARRGEVTPSPLPSVSVSPPVRAPFSVPVPTP